MSSERYCLKEAGGLQAFDMGGQWYVFLPALAKVIDKVPENMSVLLKRKKNASLQPGQGDPQVILASNAGMPAEWKRLVNTYSTVQAKLASGGEYKRKKLRAPPNLTLYPLKTCVKIVRHYTDDVEPAVTRAVEQFWLEVHPDQAVADDEEERKDIGPAHRQLGGEDRQDEFFNDVLIPGRMKREPDSYLNFPTIMKGQRIIIDLTRLGDSLDDSDAD
jgi:hypothetical protein